MCCPTVNSSTNVGCSTCSSYLTVSCSVSLCRLRSAGILDYTGRCLNDWVPGVAHCRCAWMAPGGSHWNRRVQADIFPTGQFQHHHSGPFAEEQCDRWKHRTLCNEIDLTGSVGLAGMQVDNVVPADKKDVYLLPVSVSFQIDTAVLEFRSLLVVVLVCLVPRVTPSAPCRRARIAPGGSH